MRLLLTSGGVTNDAIRDRLVELLGRPIEQCTALAIPSAQWGHPMCTPQSAWRFVAGASPSSLTGLGWAQVGMLELTALPTLDRARWEPWVRSADALLVDGGEACYLAHWLRESGMADLLESLTDTVWVGVSAGSMVLTPRIGTEFVEWVAPDGGDRTLGLVDFSIFPHLDHEQFPENSLDHARAWAQRIGGSAYALDDLSAISVSGGVTEVVSQGHWVRFPE